MLEEQGNLWDGKTIVITTNGFVKTDGSCVMGRGCARQAMARYPGISKTLGGLIQRYGNQVMDLGVQHDGIRVITFPVKPVTITYDGNNVVRHMADRFKIGQSAPGWAAKATIMLIEQSTSTLAHYVKETPIIQLPIRLPRPGCGAGELRWEDVRPILEKYLDDNFIAVSY